MDYVLFDLIVKVGMSTKKTLYERVAYTSLDLLGDFGGFNESMMILFGFLMFYYNEMRYHISTSSEFSVAKEVIKTD